MDGVGCVDHVVWEGVVITVIAAERKKSAPLSAHPPRCPWLMAQPTALWHFAVAK
jgi:hypothetical protein